MFTIKKNQLDELVGGDMNSSGGDRNVTNDSEVETGPIQKPFNDNSSYTKGESPTTDKVVSSYRQDIPWFAVYSFGGTRDGIQASNLNEKKDSKKILTKKTVEELIEDLVGKSNHNDITYKGYNNKLDKIMKTINNTDLTDDEIKELGKLITNKKPKENKTI